MDLLHFSHFIPREKIFFMVAWYSILWPCHCLCNFLAVGYLGCLQYFAVQNSARLYILNTNL